MRKGNTERAGDAEAIGAAVLRVLERIERHLGVHPNVTGKHRAMAIHDVLIGHQNIDTKLDAFVADERRRTSDKLANFVLRLPAEVAIDRVIGVLSDHASPALMNLPTSTDRTSATSDQTRRIFRISIVPSPSCQAAREGSADKSTPLFFASFRIAGTRQAGIAPVLENFQLDTVEAVSFSARATSAVPPSASMMAAAFCMAHNYVIRNALASG